MMTVRVNDDSDSEARFKFVLISFLKKSLGLRTYFFLKMLLTNKKKKNETTDNEAALQNNFHYI